MNFFATEINTDDIYIYLTTRGYNVLAFDVEWA